jgi:hypothetical protein
MNQNQTPPKPTDAEQSSPKGLDETHGLLLVSDLIAELRSQAEDMRCQQNLGSYADRTEDAADTLEKYVKAMDAIYNHNAAASAAVIQHFGLWHHTANAKCAGTDASEKNAMNTPTDSEAGNKSNL